MDSTAISRYARALFNLAEGKNELPKTAQDLEAALELVRHYPEISHLVLNSTISQSEKEDFIDKVFPADMSRMVLQLIKILIKKKRFKQLDLLRKSFQKLFEKKQGIQEVAAITAVPLHPATEEKLRQALKRIFRSEIRLTTQQDPSILGGFILRFDGQEIDGSYQNRLEEIRQRLMA